MTALAALSTPKFAVLVADTRFSNGESYTGQKIYQLSPQAVVGMAGDTGPISRRIHTGSADGATTPRAFRQWLLRTIISLESHPQPEDYVEWFLFAARGKLALFDYVGTQLEPLEFSAGPRLPVQVHAAGSGRVSVLSYVMSALEESASPVEYLRNPGNATALLTRAIQFCSTLDTSVGADCTAKVVR